MVAFGHEGNITFNTGTGFGTKVPGSATTQFSRGKTGLVIAGIVLLIAVVGFFLLRNQLLVPDQPTATTTIIAATSKIEQPTLTEAPATQDALVTALPALAPACSEGVNFAVPTVKETQNYCVQKIPYASALAPDDASYTVLNTDGGKCRVEAVKNGEQIFSCTGPSFTIIQLQVCYKPKLSEQDLAQCSADSTYNADNKCCAAIPLEQAGCQTLEIQLKGCGG